MSDSTEFLADISVREFEDSLARGSFLLTLRILHLAFASGVILFGGVVAFLFFGGAGEEMNRDLDPGLDSTFLWALSGVHGMVAVVSWIMGPVLHGSVFRLGLRALSAGRSSSGASGDIADEVIRRSIVTTIVAASIFRLAALEAPALLGLVTCLVGVLGSGVIHEQPLLWVNAISAVVLVLFIAVTFPTTDRVVDIFRTRFASVR